MAAPVVVRVYDVDGDDWNGFVRDHERFVCELTTSYEASVHACFEQRSCSDGTMRIGREAPRVEAWIELRPTDAHDADRLARQLADYFCRCGGIYARALVSVYVVRVRVGNSYGGHR